MLNLVVRRETARLLKVKYLFVYTKVPDKFATSNVQASSKGFFKALICRPPCICVKTKPLHQFLLRAAILVGLSALYVY
jgi:hypothetical protein